MAVCRWNRHTWSSWWPAQFGMLRRFCERPGCGVLEHARDRDTAGRIRGAK